tara:strand:- start:14913 stop:15020 length:108 start_codon:yes stop_codon:yes gene_type:complete
MPKTIEELNPKLAKPKPKSKPKKKNEQTNDAKPTS